MVEVSDEPLHSKSQIFQTPDSPYDSEFGALKEY